MRLYNSPKKPLFHFIDNQLVWKTSSNGGNHTEHTQSRDGVASETSLCSRPIFKQTNDNKKKKSRDHMITLDIWFFKGNFQLPELKKQATKSISPPQNHLSMVQERKCFDFLLGPVTATAQREFCIFSIVTLKQLSVNLEINSYEFHLYSFLFQSLPALGHISHTPSCAVCILHSARKSKF